MRNPFLFVVVTAFFIGMNFLLWRSEFGGHSRHGSSMPARTVIDKIITAPDNSQLQIRHHGTKVGNCYWSASVGDGRLSGKVTSDDPVEEGMVEAISGYTIELDGNTSLDSLTRVRFNCILKLSTNHTWQEFVVRVSLRPYVWEVRATAGEETIRLHTEDDEGKRDRLLSFADLRNPDKLLREFGGSLFPTAGLTALLLPRTKGPSLPTALAVKWEARHDWLNFGRNRMRVYRLEARLLESYHLRVFVSPAGEILRVELPDEILFINEDVLSY